MDGGTPSDPDVVRLWVVATVAETFGQLPTVVAADLDSDPEQTTLSCATLLRYAEAKRAFDRAEDEDDVALKAWKGSWIMEQVERNAFEFAHRRKHPGLDVEECRTCVKIRARLEEEQIDA